MRTFVRADASIASVSRLHCSHSSGLHCTFCNAITFFPVKWRPRNDCRNSILMMCHYPNLGGASDWSRHVRNLIQPIRSTTQIRVVSRHQYGISALVCQTSFRGKTVVASRNVGCFLRLQVLKPAMLFYQREPRGTCTNHFDVCHLCQYSFSFCRLKLWTCLIQLTASQSLSPANG